MSADVWFKQDIANALLAAYNSKAQTLALFGDGREAAMYRAGCRDIVADLALLFGINPAAVLPDGAGRKCESDTLIVSGCR